jgi:hypothetical protein
VRITVGGPPPATAPTIQVMAALTVPTSARVPGGMRGVPGGADVGGASIWRS